MSRSRYTSLVHKEQRIQLVRQEKALIILARQLRSKTAETTAAPMISESKQQRRVRLAQKQEHKPKRHAVALDVTQTTLAPAEAAA